MNTIGKTHHNDCDSHLSAIPSKNNIVTTAIGIGITT